jgi:hypothetical protein
VGEGEGNSAADEPREIVSEIRNPLPNNPSTQTTKLC